MFDINKYFLYFHLLVPNETTIKAIKESRLKKLKSFDNISNLLIDLYEKS